MFWVSGFGFEFMVQGLDTGHVPPTCPSLEAGE